MPGRLIVPEAFVRLAKSLERRPEAAELVHVQRAAVFIDQLIRFGPSEAVANPRTSLGLEQRSDGRFHAPVVVVELADLELEERTRGILGVLLLEPCHGGGDALPLPEAGRPKVAVLTPADGGSFAVDLRERFFEATDALEHPGDVPRRRRVEA